MSSLNKVILLGRLGKDPEIKFIDSGKAVCNFSMATSDQWKDKDGNKKEDTQWHNIVIWGKQAESCGQYLKKGSMCCVEGKIKTRSYENKENKKVYVTEILADNVKFLDSKSATKEQPQAADDCPY